MPSHASCGVTLVGGLDPRFETKHGPEGILPPGNRVEFTDVLESARIDNGSVGTITGIDARTGVIRARLMQQPGRGGRWRGRHPSSSGSGTAMRA